MRIALLTTQWPGVRLGGIGVYSVACARGLARAGHDVHIFTLTLPKDALRDLGKRVTVHELEFPTAPVNLPTQLMMGGEFWYRTRVGAIFGAALLQAHEKIPFDIVEGPEYEGLGRTWVGQGFAPLVTHLHSGTAIAREVAKLECNAEQAMMEAFELGMVESDGVCAPSRAVIEDTWRAYGMENPSIHVTVIPLPVETPDVPFQLPPEPAPALYIGRLELLKGAHLLAEAAQLYLRKNPAATLRIVGPDTMTAPDALGKSSGRSMADSMRRQLGNDLLERVFFLGEMTPAQIKAELAHCGFVIVPSLRESYSYVCCEAMGAGRPIVVSDGIGAAEVVGNAGIPFKRGDSASLAEKMGSMWENGELRARLSRVAWERARTELSILTAIEKRVAFYESVISQWKTKGEDDFENRPALLPKTHYARQLLAMDLEKGELSMLPQLIKLAQVDLKIYTPGMRVVERLNLAESGLPHAGIRFYLYGAGRHTAKLLMEKQRWEVLGHKVAGLIDDHPRFTEGPSCYGLPVISLATAQQQLQPTDIIILSTDAFEDQFWHQTEPLRKKGITVLRLYGHQSSEK